MVAADMNDAVVHELARRAGIAVEWIDYTGQQRRVSIGTLRSVLAALGLPCATAAQVADSRRALDRHRLPLLITATAGEDNALPLAPADIPPRARLTREDGTIVEVATRHAAGAASLPGIYVPGYHILEIGGTRTTLAVAPARCHTISDIAPGARLWGLTAQIYGLRAAGDCGIGDMAGVVGLARAAASLKADAVLLSPTHALFAADPNHFGPYSPSSRLFYNPLHADARSLFGEERFARAVANAGIAGLPAELEKRSEIDWPRSAQIKMSIFRRLFDEFSSTDLLASEPTTLAADFAEFRNAGGSPLQDHARFEALHAARMQADPAAPNWTHWPAKWRNPRGAAVKEFAGKNAQEILFHSFLQWIADRSFAAAQREAKQSGMRIGLIADVAIGMSGAGSDAWTGQDDVLIGLDIGAPPDLFNRRGQNWGLTTFSPRALVRGGFAPFIATLRACMRHTGGVRIDHAMGLMRLWVIPHGAQAAEGAYLSYPIDDLLRLTALESHRHCAIVIGEDLGTVPAGFHGRLAATGIDGMRVLWFERGAEGYRLPEAWSADAAAMTSTHDLPTVAGWWRGRDIAARAQCGLVKDEFKERAQRVKDRRTLWSAFRAAGVERAAIPAPEEAPRVVDAAVKFIARTPARLALVPLEDALALEDQPNLPGTLEGHPNWRRRYQADAGALMAQPGVGKRLDVLNRRGAQ
jgi:4-alpha-glucanotransferase